MKSLRDKTVVVTGASRGIGRAAALAFAGRGANLVLAARRVELLEEVKSEVEQSGVKALVVPTDVTVSEQLQRLVDASIEHFGGIDVLVNNAGSGLVGAFTETPMEEIRKLFELNFFAAIELMQLTLEVMERQGWGVVINVASTAGILPSPYISIYNASKAALVMTSESAYYEYRGTRIDICTFCPGVTQTDFESASKGFGMIRKWVRFGKATTAEWVAEKLVHAALKPKPLIAFGTISSPAAASRFIFRPVYDTVVMRFRDRIRQANSPDTRE